MKQHNVYIGLGSNMGDRARHLSDATALIETHIGQIRRKSSVYVSPPWGFEAKEDFYNSVILIETVQNPEVVLAGLLEIESQLGRVRSGSGSYESRIIDLDIIDFDGQVISSGSLELPHPRTHLRSFVLFPLREIDPDWLHPVFHKSANDLISALEKQDDIRLMNDTTP